MFNHPIFEPIRAYWTRKRLERLQYEAALGLLKETAAPERVDEEPDVADWQLLFGRDKDNDDTTRRTIRDKARHLADHNSYARNVLTLYRNYTVGTGMWHEVAAADGTDSHSPIRQEPAAQSEGTSPALFARIASLWRQFLALNEWDTGNRKDWEFCTRTWRDGECFVQLFRQPTWPPRIHFVDPEHIAPNPRTGEPNGGIETMPGNVETPRAYHFVPPDDNSSERIEADRMLHVKIGVDANVKRGVSIFLPVMDALKRFQGWLDVELIHRKMAASIVMVRKHPKNNPAGIAKFADEAATSLTTLDGKPIRRGRIPPGTILDIGGYDLDYRSPNTRFADASILGRTILLSIAAGTGLPEFMLSADASNGNYASTLVAEGPAVHHFAAWQAFFIGQWRKLFGMVMREAVRLGLLTDSEWSRVSLQITPPAVAVRNRLADAQADAVYFDRGALSARELARRDGVNPDRMQQERRAEHK